MPAEIYGEKFAVYGSKTCRKCGKVHDPKAFLEESSESRFKLIQFAAELATIDVKSDKQLSTARTHRFKEELKKQKAADGTGAQNPGKAEFANAPVNSNAAAGKAALAAFKGMLAARKGRTPSMVDLLARQNQSLNTSKGADWKGMLGLLISPLGIFVSSAGKFDGTTDGVFTHVARKKGYRACGKFNQTSVMSIGGKEIPAEQFSACQANATVPGSCAAPKLIQAFMQETKNKSWKPDRTRSLAEQGFAMSEVYFVPNTRTRFKAMYPEDFDVNAKPEPNKSHLHVNDGSGLYWLPGLTAHSCVTCEQLVPLLLCP